MIIELYGLPGSGKTTLSKYFSALPKWTTVSLSSKKEILLYFFLGFFTHPFFWLQGFFQCISKHRSLFYLWNFYCIRYAKYKKALSLSSKGTFVILDEGLLQNIISYPDSVVDYKKIVQYVKSLPKVDKVIVFDIPEEKRNDQLYGRSYQSWRTHSRDNKGWNSIMKQNDATFKTFANQDERYYFYDGETNYEQIKTIVMQ